MGMAYAVKSGKKEGSDMPASARGKIKKMLRSMSSEDLRDYAETKEKNLPNRKSKTDTERSKINRDKEKARKKKEIRGAKKNAKTRGRSSGKVYSS
jgi:hypothetical protein